MIEVQIDDAVVSAEDADTLFEAARKAGIYVPALCTHPGIRPAKGCETIARVYRGAACIEGSGGSELTGCGLCVVEVDGLGQVLACETKAQEGMIVCTTAAQLDQLRRERLAPFLVRHPHACIYCPYGEGCDLVECTFGTPLAERCCAIFGNCELQRMAQYLGRIDDLSEYTPIGRPAVTAEPLIDFNYELCVGCARCVAACRAIGSSALGYTVGDDEVVVGTVGHTLKDSHCIFCGACVEVCPTAALTDKSAKAKLVRAKRLALPARLMPPRSRALPLHVDAVRAVPHSEGVYQLLDGHGEVILIKGTEDLHVALEEALTGARDAVSFTFAEDQNYTSRESQLLQQFVQNYGRMPRISFDLNDLL